MRKAQLIGILLIAVLLVLGACAPAQAPTPTPEPAAEFQVMSLDIKPPEVMPGETVNITVEVKNTGSSQGTYTAILTVDGADIETKEITLAPGITGSVTFSLVKDTPGTYQIGIGGLTSSLTVKEKPVVKEIELKYDDGTAEAYASAGHGGGQLVDFSPPTIPFTIKKVLVCGVLVSSGWEGKEFKVQIWDKEQKVLHSASYPFTRFPVVVNIPKSAPWIEIEVPNVEVNGDFHVHVYTDSHRGWGVAIGIDRSVVNQHSNGTTGYKIWDVWPPYSSWLANKENVNWMIRVIGTVIER